MSACGAGNARVPMPPRPPPGAHPLHHMAWDAEYDARTRPMFQMPNLGIDDVRRAWKEGAAANLADASEIFNPGSTAQHGKRQPAKHRKYNPAEAAEGLAEPTGEDPAAEPDVIDCTCDWLLRDNPEGSPCPENPKGTMRGVALVDKYADKCTLTYTCHDASTMCDCTTFMTGEYRDDYLHRSTCYAAGYFVEKVNPVCTYNEAFYKCDCQYPCTKDGAVKSFPSFLDQRSTPCAGGAVTDTAGEFAVSKPICSPGALGKGVNPSPPETGVSSSGTGGAGGGVGGAGVTPSIGGGAGGNRPWDGWLVVSPAHAGKTVPPFNGCVRNDTTDIDVIIYGNFGFGTVGPGTTSPCNNPFTYVDGDAFQARGIWYRIDVRRGQRIATVDGTGVYGYTCIRTALNYTTACP